MGQEGMRILQQLQTTGSVSATIILKLKLTRQIVKEVYSKLRRDRVAQVALTEVLGATRYKFAHADN